MDVRGLGRCMMQVNDAPVMFTRCLSVRTYVKEPYRLIYVKEPYVKKKKSMKGLMSEITDKVSFGQRDQHLHLCPQMKQVW